MGQRFTYDCVLTHAEDGWCVQFPQFEEAYTDGRTREEALSNAAEVLGLVLAGRIEQGVVPTYERTAEVVSVSIELTDEDIDETHYMTQAAAAEHLGVSRPRITALINAGILKTKWFEGTRKVLISSVEGYRLSPRKSGRPAKTRCGERTVVPQGARSAAPEPAAAAL